jgi:putative copper export protein
METLLVLVAAFALVIALALALRRHGRLSPRDAQEPPKAQRAESWLTKGSGRG